MPLGQMIATANEEALYLLRFLNGATYSPISEGYTSPLYSIEKELTQYFKGELREFKTPLFLPGSPFQKRVWQQLQQIPFGQTVSYAELACSMDRTTAYRAVAQANSANQFAIVIPCHRAINSNGKLGGYNGGISRKKWLIEHELNQ